MKPYFENVADIYYRTAVSFYQSAILADPETADSAGYLRRGNEMRDMALEAWPLSVRQENRLNRKKRAAEMKVRLSKTWI